jgi:ribosomal protein S18 acetylase RimI-like enzyme
MAAPRQMRAFGLSLCLEGWVGSWVSDMHSLRPATFNDIPFLADVVIEATRAQGRLPVDFDEQDYRDGFAEWTRGQIDGADPDNTTSVIEWGGRAIGRLRVVRTQSAIELAGIQLLPDAQSRGVGSRIVGGLVNEAAETKRSMTLSVEADNIGAQRLYLRLGFVETGRTNNDIEMAFRGQPRPGLASG